MLSDEFIVNANELIRGVTASNSRQTPANPTVSFRHLIGFLGVFVTGDYVYK